MADEAEKTRVNLREKKEKISRRWAQKKSAKICEKRNEDFTQISAD